MQDMVGRKGWPPTPAFFRPGPVFVMPGLVRGIHVPAFRAEGVDGGGKPGHDGKNVLRRALDTPPQANRYAPPFSIDRWNAGRACIRPSQPARFGYGSNFPNTFAISPTKLI